MARSAKISPIQRDYSNTSVQTMQSGLAAKGFTRIPGTGVFKYPYKERTGKYRTGLDPNADYIKRIQDDTERTVETERVKALLEKLEAALGVDLSPNSKFWNYSLAVSGGPMHVEPMKLIDGDNYFDLDNPMQELQFSWLRVHPTIASSYQAWLDGKFDAETQFYVVDDEVESKVLYLKKQEINKAIMKLDTMSATRRRKVARQFGLPVSEDTKDEVVYNLIDNELKKTEFKSGKFQGSTPVKVFNRIADMDNKVLEIKDLIKQAITHSIYRQKASGAIFKGDYQVAKDEEELVVYLSNDNNQEDRILLEQDLRSKLVASV
jgi:hypothetical protein